MNTILTKEVAQRMLGDKTMTIKEDYVNDTEVVFHDVDGSICEPPKLIVDEAAKRGYGFRKEGDAYRLVYTNTVEHTSLQ